MINTHSYHPYRIIDIGQHYPRITYHSSRRGRKSSKARASQNLEDNLDESSPARKKKSPISQKQKVKEKALAFLCDLLATRTTKGFSLHDLQEKVYRATSYAKRAVKKLVELLRLKNILARCSASARITLAADHHEEKPDTLLKVMLQAASA